LTTAEKQMLQTKKISQKLLQDYAPDEIAALLEASPGRAEELNALAEFQSIPSLGINFAEGRRTYQPGVLYAGATQREIGSRAF
jgi:hypothetical protein